MEKEIIRYSVSPSGEKYSLPLKQDYENELKRIKGLVDKARKEKKEIIVVMGLGFVGAVMAAIVADTTDENGKPSKFVIGCQRASARSYWKIPHREQERQSPYALHQHRNTQFPINAAGGQVADARYLNAAGNKLCDVEPYYQETRRLG